MVKSPCLSCNNRYFSCHSQCDDYKQFRSALDKVNELRKENNQREYDLMRCIVRCRPRKK